MASDFSFDIVSSFDHQELVNSIDQAKKELGFRYDFKNSPYEIVTEKDNLTINAEDNYKLEAIIEVLRSKLAGRKLDQRILDTSLEAERAGGNTVRKKIPLVASIDKEKAKEISKAINTSFKKIKVSIQGEEIRVASPSKDTLQEVMSFIKEKDFKIPLQFTNYR